MNVDIYDAIAAAIQSGRLGGVDILGEQILPFFLAARSAANPGKDLLGEALSSSYEAFRHTRRENAAGKDDVPETDEPTDSTHSPWFLAEFDQASSIEQRTGRVDRLGCKAENRHPIPVYLPYLAGTADERQYRVMTDRGSWFRIVMGQEEVARIIPNEDEGTSLIPLRAFQENLVFTLGIE